VGDLAGELRDALGGDVSIEGLRRLSGGASRITSSFEAVAPDGTRTPLVVQQVRSGGGGSGPGMATEVAALRTAAAAGVPVPRVVAVGEETSFVVLEHVFGETIARKILRDDEYAEARPVLAGQCGRALAALHAMPAEAVPGLDVPDQVAQFRAVLDASGQPHPAFELGFRHLEATRPAASATTVVHGDFRLGNLIVGPDGLRAVIDWELVHLGDPLEDLSWLCVKSWRFGAAPRVGGFGEVSELVSAYEEASGRSVDLDALRWWETFGTLKWGIMCIMQAAAHLTGAARSVELAAIGRRVCEVEHDLLLLLP
jgi:aminoglycoside phosphotransferase (APT) family kinase protein